MEMSVTKLKKFVFSKVWLYDLQFVLMSVVPTFNKSWVSLVKVLMHLW